MALVLRRGEEKDKELKLLREEQQKNNFWSRVTCFLFSVVLFVFCISDIL